MTAISLGMPEAPPPVLAPRRQTRQIKVGKVGVGSESPVSVQSMTTTLTSDVNSTLQQIAELTATGCDIVRVACPSQDDADALAEIAQHSQIPVIADIHFQPKYVFAAIDAGCAAVRVNPGNIRKFDDQVKEIARAAKDRGTSIRIGVNAGCLDKRILEKYGKATPEALVESAVWEAGLFEEHDFHDFKISVKHNDPVVMVRAYELLAEAGDWPLHLGVTEAGPAFQGTIKSATAFGALLSQGIGDTIRVSLSAPPVEEVKVGIQILQSLNLRPRKLEIVSCPSCGRAQVDVYTLAEQVTAGPRGHGGPAARGRHGLRRQRPGGGPRGRPRRRVRQRQGPDLRQGRGHQDRARVADRRDPDRGGHAHRRGHGVRRRRRGRRSPSPEPFRVGRRLHAVLTTRHGSPAPRGRGPRRLLARWPVATRWSTSSPTTARRRPTSSRAGSAARCGAASRPASSLPPATSAPTWCRCRRVPTTRRPSPSGPWPGAGRCPRSSGRRTPYARFWNGVASAWGRPREARWDQPHLEIAAGPLVAPDPLVRRTTREDMHELYPGLRRDVHRGGRDLAGVRRRRRPLPRPRHAAGQPGLVLRALRRHRPAGVQGGGRLRDAVRRPDPGRLRARRPPRARASPPRAWRRWSSWYAARSLRSVSLYVNDCNTSARAVYERVGFRRDRAFATVMF